MIAAVPPPELIREHPLVEQILAGHSDRARGDDGRRGPATRGHVYRVLNFARALTPDAGDRDDKLAIAGAFHDLEAFGSLDYLAPVDPRPGRLAARDRARRVGRRARPHRRRAPPGDALPRRARPARRGVSPRRPRRRQPGPRPRRAAARLRARGARRVRRRQLLHEGRPAGGRQAARHAVRGTRCRTCARAARSRKPATRVPTADGMRVAGWRAWHESEF